MEAFLEMSESSDRAPEIVQYLLGTLPEAETERFDALSVADAEFANELNATEQNLVDAYVEGGLTGATLARFESHYLASPRRREKVEFARAFQTLVERKVAGSRTAGFLSRPRISHQSLILRWSLAAAAVILLATGGWWTLQNLSSRADKQLMATFVLAPPSRASARVPTLSIPRGGGAIEIQLELESDDHAGYRVALADDTGETEFWRSDRLKATHTERKPRLAVRFPAQLVQAQIYSLVVTGIGLGGSEEIISNYPFRAQMQ